ncbi:hypothetical protein ACT7CV_16440 [Bacillus paranthracis]
MTYKNDCVQDNQGENGNKLKQLLHVNMKAEILNIALQHVSYQNENRLSSEQLEKEKAKSMLGYSLLNLLFHAHFLQNSRMTIQDINKLENIEQLASDIYSYYKINDLIYRERRTKRKKNLLYGHINKSYL